MNGSSKRLIVGACLILLSLAVSDASHAAGSVVKPLELDFLKGVFTELRDETRSD